MTEPDATGSIEIAASPRAAYNVVSDPRGLPSVSEETARIIRFGQRRFMGVNRRPGRVWATLSKITDAEPGVRYAFEVSGGVFQVARWQYDFEETETGCRVTESMWDRRPNWALPFANTLTGVADRRSANSANIDKTLQRLKEHLER